MKKIIKSSALIFAVCFFAGTAKAQLASERPRPTVQQVTEIQKEKSGVKISVAPVADKKTASAMQVPGTLANLPSNNIINTEPAKTTQPATTSAAVLASGQGIEKPIKSAPAEIKVAPVPTQEEKPVIPVKQQ